MNKLQLTFSLFLFCGSIFTGIHVFAQSSGASGTPSGGRTAANGEIVLRAFQMSFPEKISNVSFLNNDWTITVDGEIFYWAGGRLLPAALKDNIDNYIPHMFYPVPARPVSPSSLSPEQIESLRRRGSNEARSERRDPHRAFYGRLYGGLQRNEIEMQLERIEFLGFRVTVHRYIAEKLKQIDADIRKLDGGNAFIVSIRTVEGYSWRQIAGTQRMSYHSWGLAVDIQPRALGGRAIYWLWERQRNEDWMLVPLEMRWSPPEQVIEIFEKAGFFWGGKWAFYDNMHFEYRPELFALSRFLSADTSAIGSGQVLHHIHPDNIR